MEVLVIASDSAAGVTVEIVDAASPATARAPARVQNGLAEPNIGSRRVIAKNDGG